MWAGADLLMPVPLHWTRRFARRFNQSALLARAIRDAGGPLAAADWLVRRRRTPSQGTMGRRVRAHNVRAAFALRCARSAKGRQLVLIDDLLTTGATDEECGQCCAAPARLMSW